MANAITHVYVQTSLFTLHGFLIRTKSKFQQKPREVEVRKFESKAFPGVALYNERVDSLRRYDKVRGQFMGYYLK